MTLTRMEQAIGALAFAGDLSMGQPPDHSPNVARLAARLADSAGADADMQANAARLAMLRWAGCTSNAREFAMLFGDDVGGRAAYIEGRNPFVATEPPNPASLHDTMVPIAVAHCEAVVMICQRLGLPDVLIHAAEDFFENWDGSGLPAGKAGDAIHEAAQYVALAGDIEVYGRNFGTARATLLIENRAGKVYDPSLAQIAIQHMDRWLKAEAPGDACAAALACCALGDDDVSLSDVALLLADYSDLKRPDMTGVSRLAQGLSLKMAEAATQDPDEISAIGFAAALADLGQVAVPNPAFDHGAGTSEAARLAPHWTERILSRAPDLLAVARLASLAYERMDGSGFNRGLTAAAQPFEARIVQVARLATVERMAHGLRAEWPVAHLRTLLTAEAKAGRLDLRAVRLALEAMGARNLPSAEEEPVLSLTAREQDVLAGLIAGQSNKEIARGLELSPKTVGTHVEKIFRKLGVSSRAAAAMKALDAGLVAP
ncbi:HD domain-containing phosphohydrolase [uncultured Tateyamaria sp.]|uniref:HD domain-containing phosphohydrolase n=1 Tax=uncultured Tateyamaria sp. TaxID=455651 RepID=UPI002622B759|nr:HD domain-containing phosphohydrolase [uncultured Tateyamaria sp.]